MQRDPSRIYFLLLLFSSFACSTLFPAANTIPEDISDAVITLQRTVCYGTCPDYEVAIYGDGTVVYAGNNFVVVEGKRTYSVPAEDVLRLVQLFYEIDYFSMDDRYEESVTDLPSTTITITIEGETKSVYMYGMNLPSELIELSQLIDEIAQTSELVGK